MLNYIGIAGPARSGKDTTAAWFLGRGYRQYSFARPLKDGLCAMLGLDGRHTDGELKELDLELYGASPRRMMQTLGTEWGRGIINSQIWLLRATEITEEWLREPGVSGVVISDVRFENEASWIREKGGLLVHLRRTAANGVAMRRRSIFERLFSLPWRPLVSEVPHESEAGIEIEAGDALIRNDGTIEELHDQLFGIMGRTSNVGRRQGQVS